MSDPNQPVRLAFEGSNAGAEVLFIHATGFCKEVWRPVTDSLTARRPGTSTLAVDLRGHGDSPAPGPPYRWDAITDDVVFTVGEHGRMVGVGHSLGGTIIARVAALEPDMFSHIVLIEPIILPPPYARMNIPLARAAQRRKGWFPSRAAARTRFRSGLMVDWTDDSLDAYVDHGFTEQTDGVFIKCAPDVEADVFREGSNHDTWDLAAGIDIPVTIMAGNSSDTHTPEFLSMIEGRFPSPEMVIIPDSGHFLPMEQPGVVANLVAEILGDA